MQHDLVTWRSCCAIYIISSIFVYLFFAPEEGGTVLPETAIEMFVNLWCFLIPSINLSS